MFKVRFNPQDAEAVCTMLDTVRRDGRVSAETRKAATMWAGEIRPTMEREDVQSVAWILREASGSRRMSRSARKQARYLAAYLEGRL